MCYYLLAKQHKIKSIVWSMAHGIQNSQQSQSAQISVLREYNVRVYRCAIC